MPIDLDFPIPSVTVIPWSVESLGVALGSTAASSGAYPAANRAILVPFRVYRSIKAYSMFLVNGATGSFLFDLGIYDPAGTLLVSTGGTSQSGNNNLQETNFAASIRLTGGLYYMAISMSSATATLFRRTTNNNLMNALGCHVISASAYPLPATGTFATVPASTNLPLFGVRTYA